MLDNVIAIINETPAKKGRYRKLNAYYQETKDTLPAEYKAAIEILIAICSRFANGMAISKSRYPDKMLNPTVASMLIDNAHKLGDAKDSVSIYDYAWCCGLKEKVLAKMPDFFNITLSQHAEMDSDNEVIARGKVLLRAIALAFEEDNRQWRKNAISATKDFFNKACNTGKAPRAAQFLEWLSWELKDIPKAQVLFSEQYVFTIDALETGKQGDFDCALMLERILDLDCYRYGEQEKLLKAAKNLEFLSEHASGNWHKLHVLEKAERCYTRAGNTEDAARISRRRLEIGRDTKFEGVPVRIPDEIIAPLHSSAERIKHQLTKAPFEEAIAKLVLDPYNIVIPKAEFDRVETAPMQNATDFPGITIGIQGSQDGRTHTQADDIATKNVHRMMREWQVHSSIGLTHFEQTIHVLLDPNLSDVQARFKAMVKILSEPIDCEEQAQMKICSSLNTYIAGEYFNFICTAVPIFEELLRRFLINRGFSMTKLKTESGEPTEYKTMDALYREDIFQFLPENIVLFIRSVLLSGKRNCGLNLRNDVAHGILQWQEYNSFSASIVLYLMLTLSGIALQNFTPEETVDGIAQERDKREEQDECAAEKKEEDGEIQGGKQKKARAEM